MDRLIGFILLIVGAVLLYEGWQAHEIVAASAGTSAAHSAKSVWLLALGAIAAVWGLCALLRRTVM